MKTLYEIAQQRHKERKAMIGMKVKVYYDPLTETEFEGEAKIIKHVTDCYDHHNGRRSAFWVVEFADGNKVTRKILE